MPGFGEQMIERVISTSQENAGEIAQSLNLCFDCRYRVEIGKWHSWDALAIPDEMDGPGLLVAIQLGDHGLLLLLPESLPLPTWYTQPGKSQHSRLQTLAMEWSLSMLPLDMEADQYVSLAVDNLKAGVLEATPAESAGMLELLVFDKPAGEGKETSHLEPASPADAPEAEDSSGDDEPAESPEVTDTRIEAQPVARIYLVAPVMNPPLETTAKSNAERKVVSAGDQPPATGSPASAPASRAGDTGVDVLSQLPVTVAVRLAEKKIELGNLLSLTPGALITFDKSCDDLLDLFVNNRLYCRGEAVKIGEKFGLKINEVGAQEVRETRVMNT